MADNKRAWSTWKWNRAKFEQQIEKDIKRRLTLLVHAYERKLQEMFRLSKHGRVYKVGKSQRDHIASAPGEAPAILTGRLRQAVTHKIERLAPGIWAAFVGVALGAAKYARALELGTPTMKPRPAWMPAMQAIQKEAAAVLGKDP